MKQREADERVAQADPQLQRVAALLREIEDEAIRLMEGRRGASLLSIVSRAASARRYLDHMLELEPVPDPAAAVMASGYQRRIRTAIHDLRLSPAMAANLTGTTEEEMGELLRGADSALPLDQLERVAGRLESEQQLAMLPLV